MAVEITLLRHSDDGKQTLGTLRVKDHSFFTLELPWRNNAPKISCVPPGKYKVVKRYSTKYGHHFHLTDVQGRSYILIHSGNYYTQILGCILVGLGLQDINHDGLKDVTGSKAALEKLNELLPNEFILNIINAPAA